MKVSPTLLIVSSLFLTGCSLSPTLSNKAEGVDNFVEQNQVSLLTDLSLIDQIEIFSTPEKPPIQVKEDESGTRFLSLSKDSALIIKKTFEISKQNERVAKNFRSLIKKLSESEKDLVRMALVKEQHANQVSKMWILSEKELSRTLRSQWFEVWGYRISIGALLFLLLL